MAFIKRLNVLKVRNISDLPVFIGDSSLNHLVVTGKNGSGKTSLLRAISHEIMLQISHGNNLSNVRNAAVSLMERLKVASEPEASSLRAQIASYEQTHPQPLVKIVPSPESLFQYEDFVFVFFGSRRQSTPNIPQGVQKISPAKQRHPDPIASQSFVQYLVNLRTEMSYARDDNDDQRVGEIKTWLEMFERNLKIIFEDESLELEFDRKNFNYLIRQKGRAPFSFAELSDGLSSALNIVSELIVRMDQSGVKQVFDTPAVVIIDEIETHLHVGLQKIILPFLSDLFPKAQFIVSTHSPFVLISMQNAIILDLDTREVHSDFSKYSYEAVLEEYFCVDKYSLSVKSAIRDVKQKIELGLLDEAEALLREMKQEMLKDGYELNSSVELALEIDRTLLAIKELRG